MPRVVKPKADGGTARAVSKKPVGGVAAGAVGKKPIGGKKKSKLYVRPEPILSGTVLADLSKTQWKIGPSIGTGGFGEIYSACKVGEKNYDYVVKCEPHGNGPLFVEMHFYMRNAKLEDIQRFKKQHGLKSLGMPYMLGNGSHDINGQKHRFIVMPRYGTDIARFFNENGRRLPEGTMYRLALQMIDVYEYVHNCGYVHADLKGANILLGYGKGGSAQAYLVDYGLASHFTTKEFKPDPKKMHNGTIEYTSRDAHQGVATMRADLEILGYNLIEWSGVQLPWVRDNLLTSPVKVQKAKEDFMADVGNNLKKLFAKVVPAPIADLMKYVSNMKYNEAPDYDKCRKIFAAGLKNLKIPNTGDLDFKLKSIANNIDSNAAVSNKTKKSKPDKRPATVTTVSCSSDDVDEICASDDDDTDVIFETKKTTRVALPTRILKTKPISLAKGSPVKKSPPPKQHRISPRRTTPTRLSPPTRSSPPTRLSPTTRSSPPTRASPPKRKSNPISNLKFPSPKLKRTNNSPARHQTPIQSKHKPQTTNTSASTSRNARTTPLSAKINFSPSISVSRSSSRPGKTIINDQLTPNPKPSKTYEVNFELDVSMDANVVINVKRKKKPLSATPLSTAVNGTNTSKQHTGDGESEATPTTRVKVRKLQSASDASSSPIHTPAITIKKSKKYVSSPR